jgi:hypothetical protein
VPKSTALQQYEQQELTSSWCSLTAMLDEAEVGRVAMVGMVVLVGESCGRQKTVALMLGREVRDRG